MEFRTLVGHYSERQRAGFLFVVIAFGLAALIYEWENIICDYWLPVWNGTFGFLADFQFFYDGAVRFLQNPMLLYEGNTRDGFLLIGSANRIDYGYPPPAVLLFAPFALLPMAPGFVVFTLASVMMTMVCLGMIRTLHEDSTGRRATPLLWIAVGIVMLSLGSTYVTFIFGQVNAFLLFVCLLYILLVRRGCYTAAGFCLGIGFWLKFYPVYLLALAPFERRPWRLLISSMGSILLIPLLLSPILPLDLYLHYFRHIYPGLAAETSPHVYNQSIQGILTRWFQVSGALFDWGPVVTALWIRRVNSCITLLALGCLALGYWKNQRRPLVYYWVLLAFIPMLVTYGWGGTYMIALPLVLVSMVGFCEANWFSRGLLLVVLFALILPAYRPVTLGSNLLVQLFYVRYVLVTLLLALGAVWMDGRPRACTCPETSA